jgi:hypothetical protein
MWSLIRLLMMETIISVLLDRIWLDWTGRAAFTLVDRRPMSV